MCWRVQAALEKEANEKKKKPPAMPRAAGGEKWWDPTLTEWPENDFRIFVGDLGNEVNDDVLEKAFQKFTSFAKAKVVRNKHTNKTKGTRAAPMALSLYYPAASFSCKRIRKIFWYVMIANGLVFLGLSPNSLDTEFTKTI